MPYPTWEGIATTTGLSGTSYDITLYTTGDQSGDLHVIFLATDGDNSVSNWDGFTQIAAQSEPGGKDAFHAVAYKVSTGSESNPTVQVGSDEKAAAYAVRFSGADTPTATAAGGDSDSPDPPQNVHGSGGDFVVIASFGADDDDAATGYPSLPDNQDSDTTADPGGCAIGIASDEVTDGDGTYEPGGTFTLPAIEEWVCITTMVPYKVGSLTINVSDGLSAATDLC